MVEPEELLAWCRRDAMEIQFDSDAGIWLINARGIALVENGLPRRVGADELRPHLAAADAHTTVGVARSSDAQLRDMTLAELGLAIAVDHLASSPPPAEPLPQPASPHEPATRAF